MNFHISFENLFSGKFIRRNYFDISHQSSIAREQRIISTFWKEASEQLQGVLFCQTKTKFTFIKILWCTLFLNHICRCYHLKWHNLLSILNNWMIVLAAFVFLFLCILLLRISKRKLENLQINTNQYSVFFKNLLSCSSIETVSDEKLKCHISCDKQKRLYSIHCHLQKTSVFVITIQWGMFEVKLLSCSSIFF